MVYFTDIDTQARAGAGACGVGNPALRTQSREVIAVYNLGALMEKACKNGRSGYAEEE